MKTVMISWVLMLNSGMVMADVYKCSDAQGNITYSDVKCSNNTQKLDLPNNVLKSDAKNTDTDLAQSNKLKEDLDKRREEARSRQEKLDALQKQKADLEAKKQAVINAARGQAMQVLPSNNAQRLLQQGDQQSADIDAQIQAIDQQINDLQNGD